MNILQRLFGKMNELDHNDLAKRLSAPRGSNMLVSGNEAPEEFNIVRTDCGVLIVPRNNVLVKTEESVMSTK